MKRCPCCGYLTIDDTDEVITDICDVCFWQYDEVAQNMPDEIIGANQVCKITNDYQNVNPKFQNGFKIHFDFLAFFFHMW